ncbi:AfsR/SARP family transcriptional regulator [Nonomuraea ceibae]|uniref:AfsR/SARP family transcriptional regulator n=1 Tax=Nonomuraea ceibae TaxID=1935170 RepID=UPI001C5DCC48|nr:BTAD domain-containing putative transcriptional regulator [Nonomuraea ceibae]
MRFRILGPLQVLGDAGELELGGGRQRIVLAMLLLEANQVVPISRLVEAIWGECPPGTPRNQVQIRISQLRRTLGDTAQPYQTVITKPSGYLIRIAPSDLDLTVFEHLITQAQTQPRDQAARTLREALTLWRAPALADVDSDLVRSIAHGLEERRLLAFERCVELELELGHHLRLIEELRAVTQSQPLRERPHGHLMLALYGAGRQAEALEVFRSYRTYLLDTLGLEPGEELRRIEHAILNRASPTPPATRTDTPPQEPAGRPLNGHHPRGRPTAPDDPSPAPYSARPDGGPFSSQTSGDGPASSSQRERGGPTSSSQEQGGRSPAAQRERGAPASHKERGGPASQERGAPSASFPAAPARGGAAGPSTGPASDAAGAATAADPSPRPESRPARAPGSTSRPAPTPGSASRPAPVPRPVPRQLPPVLSRLSGREAELARIEELLTERHGTTLPVVAVLGKAGVGKSELALHAAHRLADAYPDGQLYVDLQSGALRPQDALARFLRALGLPAVPRTLEERSALFRSTVAERRVLVLLDDAESMQQTEPLLPGGASCAVLVTSRRTLVGLPERQVIRLGLLDGPDAAELLTQDIGGGSAADPEAIRLLVEQCGGHPLALRIAGTSLGTWPHSAVQDLVMTIGDLDVKAVLDVGYRALSPQAQALFRRLGLISGQQISTWLAHALISTPATRTLQRELTTAPHPAFPRPIHSPSAALAESARTDSMRRDMVDDPVISGTLTPPSPSPSGAAAVLERAFQELVDAALLRRRGDHYVWHDLVRLFAAEHAFAEDPREIRTAVLEHASATLLALVEQAHRRHYSGHFTVLRGLVDLPPIDGSRLFGDEPLAWLDSELPVLIRAVRQAADHGLAELAWSLAMTAVTLFETYGYFDDWRAVSETALAACRAAGNARGEGAMLFSLSSLAIFQQRYDDAAPLVGSALAIFEKIGEDHGRALALRNAALLDRAAGDLDGALHRYTEARRLLRAVGDRAAEAYVLSNMALIHCECGRLDEADPLLREALTFYTQEGVRRGEAQALMRLAELSLRRGRSEPALEAYEKAKGIVREAHDRIGEAYVLQGLGEAHLKLGRAADAERTLREALDVAAEVGDRLIQGRARLALGTLLLESGRPGATLELERAQALFAEIHAEPLRAKAAAALSRSH